MNILDRLFRSKQAKKQKRMEYDEEIAGTRYASLGVEPVNREFHRPKEYLSGHDIVELCEQMIDVSRELEESREEYQLVTDQLNDIQTLEDMTDSEMEPILESAKHIAKLQKERNELLENKKKLTEARFAQMQAGEDELPGVIKRLKANETYLDAIKKDLNYLEGEKLMWSMQKTTGREQQQFLRKMSVCVFFVFSTLIALFLILSTLANQDTQLPMLVATALAALLGVFILVRYQEAAKSMRQSDLSKNRAITMENRVKIKYVNIKHAVDYTCEKYHVKNSRELLELYETYQEEIRDQERFRRNNDELERHAGELLRTLQTRRLYDPKVWQNHAGALLDPREMVEFKHELLARRQKLRTRIEYNINTLADMKNEAMEHADQLGDNAPQVQQIIRKLAEISASL